ncbi:30_t:CDS:2 [Racocetra fulgida]|uniref:30_t:CDS:1 n=1 Tax=Racocetra fulgida TaxID=60492 RepID=A0A9N8ZNA2_9GLOM|nr:30_t:CDS:2 [Racocetra fulgida]
MDVESYINYPEENITDKSIDDEKIVNLTRHSDNLTIVEEPDDSCIFKVIKKVRSLRTASLRQTNLELFFAQDPAKNNTVEIEYDYLTDIAMFEADEDTEMEDLESDTAKNNEV